MTANNLLPLLTGALQARLPLLKPDEPQALRLFNGFREGCPELVVDRYGRTLVFFNYAQAPAAGEALVKTAVDFYRQALPWAQAGVVKTRNAPAQAERQGRLLFGSQPDRQIQEHGVWYALDLLMNQDASFYMDTRRLRQWALEHLAGKRVLNTFAYTGSLGVAARAAGARQVVHLDLNRRFLDLAKRSYALNGWQSNPADFLVGDFFTWVGRLKRQPELFDCVFLDPPFFSATARGRVDQVDESHRLINKVRPLIADQGRLVAVNNSLFTSGADYLRTLEALCADGYLAVETLVPVPLDFTATAETFVTPPPADPAPFNHPTKIAILRVFKNS